MQVLVIAALKEEYDAARAVAGAGGWTEQDAGSAAPFCTTELRTAGGTSLSVALARPTRMGGRGIGPIVTTLTNRLRPACLAMCGVCAGRPGATAPGDVVVAAPAYEWDEGKHTGGAFRADHQQFQQDPRWLRAAQDFSPDGLPSHGAATTEEAETWFLERLLHGQNPRSQTARQRYFPGDTWKASRERLTSSGFIVWRDETWALTEAGRDRIQRTLYDDADGPDRLPFEVFAGPMASGSAVMSVPGIWDHLEVTQRQILALEMEAATIATVAHERDVPHWLVAKGVMDHADLAKDDRFKTFAARASAEVLFALLGQLLTPAAAARHTATITASVKLEVLRRLSYDWPHLADILGVPGYEIRRFRAGDEPRELWDWLESRRRLADLPGALNQIGRADLAELLRPHT